MIEPVVTLVPGLAEVCESNVNVRGQAGLKGEVVAHVQKSDSVTVLSEITLDKHKSGEPAQWAKILLPPSTKVWVDANFIDDANKTVRPKKLNLRAGPSENYSVLGVIERGTPISEIVTRNGWTQIEKMCIRDRWRGIHIRVTANGILTMLAGFNALLPDGGNFPPN